MEGNQGHVHSRLAARRWRGPARQPCQRQCEAGEAYGNRDFMSMQIRDERDLENHADYLHFNPVKHGYVKRPWDWQWSSFRRFVELGQYGRGSGISR